MIQGTIEVKGKQLTVSLTYPNLDRFFRDRDQHAFFYSSLEDTFAIYYRQWSKSYSRYIILNGNSNTDVFTTDYDNHERAVKQANLINDCLVALNREILASNN